MRGSKSKGEAPRPHAFLKNLLKGLNVPLEQVTFTATVDHGVKLFEVRGPFSALQIIEIYAELDKFLNPDLSNRIYRLQVSTTVSP